LIWLWEDDADGDDLEGEEEVEVVVVVEEEEVVVVVVASGDGRIRGLEAGEENFIKGDIVCCCESRELELLVDLLTPKRLWSE